MSTSDPKLAAHDANVAADQSLAAAKLANREAKKAVAARERTEELAPDPHRDMLRAIAAHEQGASLRIGPKRNRWADLVTFEDEMASIEQRRAVLDERMATLRFDLNDAPNRHEAELAEWLSNGSEGDRPASRARDLTLELEDLQAEYNACGLRYEDVLKARAEHVIENRRRFKRDVKAAKETVAAEYRDAIAAAEAKRQELLDLRATETWVGLFPSELLGTQPNTMSIVGAIKRLQQPHLPVVEAGIVAGGLFALLREDVMFCSTVATTEQYAALEGKTVAQLTGRESMWLGEGGVDIVGPRFEAAWAGSDEERQQTERIKRYTEQARRRIWGE